MKRANTRAQAGERGAAALVVVLLLFFIISLVAAYTSRDMIFEQRTSVNQLRSTQALEVADAGIEWALTRLNAGLIDGNCEPATAGADTFRQRYLAFDANNRISPVVVGGPPVVRPAATCLWQPSSGIWSCTCPASGGPTMPATSGDGPFPGFRVHFIIDQNAAGPRQNLIRIQVAACTDASDPCLRNPQEPQAGVGNAEVSALLGLKGAIDTLPAAAVTVPSANTTDDAISLVAPTTLEAHNPAQRGPGIAVHAGGRLNPTASVTATGAPGMPSEWSMVTEDATLAFSGPGGGLRNSTDAGACAAGDTSVGCTFNRMFASVFGAPRNVFTDQPAMVTCAAGCNSSTLAALAQLNPRSVVRVQGDATLDASVASVGSATSPVALYVEGNVSFTGAGTAVTGLVYASAVATAGSTGAWSVSGTPQVLGAVVSEGPVTLGGGGTLQVVYDSTVLSRLRGQSGSFVRVPGGWRDFPSP